MASLWKWISPDGMCGSTWLPVASPRRDHCSAVYANFGGKWTILQATMAWWTNYEFIIELWIHTIEHAVKELQMSKTWKAKYCKNAKLG